MLRRMTVTLLVAIALMQAVRCARTFAQAPGEPAQTPVDYSVLADPAFANRLALTDEQRAAVANILDGRVQKLVAAKPADRPAVLAESNQMLEQVLTAEQKTAFAALVAVGKLRFNFRQQKWPEVLDWFARQGDLSLVMDTSPPGLFSYSDTKDYTPAEAIDLLNSVLLSKGFTLMRREKMLIVVDTSAGIPFEMAPRVTIGELAERGRFEIVSVEFPLGGRNIDACLTAVKELIGPHGRATPLTTAGKLIVTETSGKLQAINEVIAAIPLPPAPPQPPVPVKPPDPVFAVYPAKGLDPKATVETLEGLFKAASIKADPTAEEIHAYAIPAIQDGIKASVEKMIANISGDNRTRLAIYAVGAKNLTQLQTQLTQAVPDAKITADETQQRLLVFANNEQQAEVKATLETLGAAAQETEGKSSVAVYPVKIESTDSLVKLLTDVLPRALVVSQPGRIAVRGTAEEQQLAQTTIDQFKLSEVKPELPVLTFYPLDQPLDAALLAAVQKAVPDAVVTPLDDGKRLSVMAKAEDQVLVAATLAHIATNLPRPAERTLEIYTPEKLAMTEVQTLLASVVPGAKINADASGKRLIIWGTTVEHEQIASTLQKVGELVAPEKPSLETYEIPSAESAAILAAVQALAPTAQSRIDTTNRRLIVIGSTLDQQLIRELITKLVPVEDKAQRVLIAYSLAKADAAILVPMLQELRPDVRFAADTRANRILVTALLREQPRLEAVIQQLDAAPDSSREEVVKPYALKTVNPAIVVELLQSLVPKMRLSVDAASKRLMAVGTEFDHQKLEKVVERLDGADAAAATIQTYEIGQTDPAQVRNVLLQLVPAAVVSSNPATRKLMVWATEADHGTIKAAIDEFTRNEPAQTRQLRTHPVPKAISTAALIPLKSIAPDAMLSLDTTGEHLIAWATPKEHEDLLKAVRELEQSLPQREDVSLRVHQGLPDVLQNASLLLVDVAPLARLVKATTTDKWLIWATEAEHQAIADLLKTLTDQTAQNTPRSIKAYPLGKADPATARQMIALQAEKATILSGTDISRLLVLGTAEEHASIEALLLELTSVSQSTDTILHVYPITDRRLTAQAVLDSLDAELTKDAVIRVNTVTNSLIVRATATGHDRLALAIAALIEQLPAPPTPNTQIFRFTRGSPSNALTVLRTLVPTATIAADDVAGTLAVTALDEDLARIKAVIEQIQAADPAADSSTQVYHFNKISAVAAYTTFLQLAPKARFAYDGTVNVVVATASEADHRMFREMATKLDDASSGTARSVKSYPLNQLDPTAARQVVALQAPKAVVVSGVDASRLVVLATTEEHASIEGAFAEWAGFANEPGTLLRVYPIKDRRLVAQTVADSLDTELTKEAVVRVSVVANSLIVRATEAGHERLRQAIEALAEQLPPPATPNTLVFRFSRGTPSTAATVLRTLVPTATIAADDVAGTLAVTALDEDLARIKAVIEQIQAADETADSSTQVYHFNKISALAAYTTFVQLAPKARFAYDVTVNVVVATASEADHRMFREMATKLDDASNGTARSVKSYPLNQLDPTAARQVVTLQAPKAVVVSGTDASRLVVLATTEEHASLEGAFAEWADFANEPGTLLRVYPIKDRRLVAQTVADSLDAALTKEAVVRVSVVANSLIVRATEAGHERLRQAIEALAEQLPPPAAPNTLVFRFSRGTPSTAATVLRTLVPTATIAADDVAGTLAATALDEDLTRIKAVVEQIQAADETAGTTTQVYRFKKAAARSAYAAFLQLAPKARIAYDDSANVVVATAPEADHQLFRDTAIELDGTPIGSITRVYPLDIERIDAADVMASLDDDLKKMAAIQVNKTANSLIVRGTEEVHTQIDGAIQAIVQQLPAPLSKTTKVYSLKRASATVVQLAVRAMLVNGTVVGDEASGSLLVTATDADHQRVTDVIDKLDVAPGQQPIVKAYPIRNTDPRGLYQTVSQAYATSRGVSVTFQPDSRTLFVVATPQDHAVFGELFAELDQPGAEQQPRSAKVYSLTNIDGDVAASSLTTLFEGQHVQVRFNTSGNALIVVATAEQHQAVEASLKQMEGIERTLEVFALRNTDPYVVENAVFDLFSGATASATPSVSSDHDTQRLFVRGTKTQIDQVRQLLVSLGETLDEGSETRQTGDVRTIPFRGDTREAVRQIEAIWSRLRPNRIQVIAPSQRDLIPRLPSRTPSESKPPDEQRPDPDQDATPKSSAAPIEDDVHFVAAGRIEPGQEAKPGAAKSQAEKAQEALPGAEKPPVVVVPDEGKITIASPDHEALDQMEALLRAMARGDGPSTSQSNFAVFLLRNTGAADTQQILKQFFDELPATRGSLGKVVVVADERLNALIVHGSRKDRDIVEQLLQVLDTSELPDPLSQSLPELIPLKNTQASRVLAILESVYKTQLTSGGGRRAVAIPKGISADVATVLQQLNAAAAGPLLTLDVDETTNSIVVRAPSELRDEIKSFVQQLDGEASERPNQAVRVIRLESAKSDRMQAVLEQFLLRSK